MLHQCGSAQEAGRSTARTADPNWAKGNSISQNMMSSKYTGGSWPEEANHCSRRDTTWGSISRWWAISSFKIIFLGFYSFSLLSLFSLLLYFTLFQLLFQNLMGFTFLQFYSSSYHGREESEWGATKYLVAPWVKPQHTSIAPFLELKAMYLSKSAN